MAMILDGGASAVGAKAEHLTLALLYQLITILVFTRIVTWLSRRFLGQTDVSGEILAGILLGPSVFKALAPGLWTMIFAPTDVNTGPVFVGIAQIGLILLMFQIGMEFEFRTHLGEDRRPIVLISLAGLILPFIVGYFTADWFHARLPEPVKPNAFGFKLFFAVAMSITAIPILGRIFMELKLSHTRTAALTIGAAAIDDVAGWLILGAISLLVVGKFSLSWALPRVAGLGVYVVLVFFILRPWLKKVLAGHIADHGELKPIAIALMLILLFVSATITSNLGVFAIIGGFVIGAALHDDRRFVETWKRQAGPLVNTFFLPVFFANTGLRTDIGSLPGMSGFWMCVLVCAIAFVTKFGGAFLAAKLTGESSRSALTIGVCMNTRALMELVVLNIGYDMGVLPKSVFTMLVIMAIVSTFMATPLIRWLMRGQERMAPAPAVEGVLVQ
jgi:Kef-type K+ transport system membrane component KefB